MTWKPAEMDFIVSASWLRAFQQSHTTSESHRHEALWMHKALNNIDWALWTCRWSRLVNQDGSWCGTFSFSSNCQNQHTLRKVFEVLELLLIKPVCYNLFTPSCSAVRYCIPKCVNNMIAIQFTRCDLMMPHNLISTRKSFHVGRKANCTLKFENITYPYPNKLAKCQHF